MKKVDFLLIGVQKAATSALHQFLSRHDQIEMSSPKELHFFDNEENFKSEIVDYEQYHSAFHSSKLSEKIYGESTPIYIYWDDAIKRIWEYNKDIKLLAVLRNPIERAYSHWQMEYNKKREFQDFSTAIRQENDKSKEALPLQHRIFSYIDRGFYSYQIRRVYRFFNPNQVLFIKHEELKNNPLRTMNNIFGFLNVKAVDNYTFDDILHKTEYISSISNVDKQYLYKIFKNDICQVEQILKWDCSQWHLKTHEKRINNWRSWLHRFSCS